MADTIFTTIYNTVDKILDFNVYEFVEGQTFFATDIKKFFKDQDGQRRAQLKFESIEVFDGNLTEFYERGTAGFEGEIVVANSPNGFRLYYVDTQGELHLLSSNTNEIIDIVQGSGVGDGADGIDGFNTFVLNFYKATSKTDALISTIVPPSNVSGTINFSSGIISDLTYTGSDVWFTDIADLDGDWTYNTSTSKWELNGVAPAEDVDAEEVKIVVSKVLLFSRDVIYNFSGITGDTPSKFREDGANQASLFLYQGTSGTKPTVFPGELVYDFTNKTFISGDLNNWSLTLPEVNSTTNQIIWVIGTAVNSNIRFSVIASSEWGTGPANIKEFARYAKDGEPGEPGQPGTPGSPGVDGLRAISGVLYFQTASTNAPSISFSGISFTISTATFSPNPPTGWGVIPPVFVANESNKYWYVNWSGQESSPNSNTISTFTNTAPVQAINFDGLVTFTDVSGNKVITTDDITSIQGGLLKTAVIESNATYIQNSQQVPRLRINFNEGTIAAQNFNIDSSGNASFAGTINASSGNIGNWNIESIGLNQWLKSIELSNNIFTSSSLLTNEFLRVSASSDISGRSYSSGIEQDKIRLQSNFGTAETYVDLAYNSLKIDSFSGSQDFTIENKIGKLALKATDITHTDTTPRFLTISKDGDLGTSTGSGGGSIPGGVDGNVQFNNNGLFGGSNNLHWNNTSGNLGIGTNAPFRKLEVTGGVNLSTTILAQLRSIHEGAGTSTSLRLANSTSNDVASGSVDLIGRRVNAGGDSAFLISTTTGGNITERVRFDNNGLSLLGSSNIQKPVGALVISASEANANIGISAGAGGSILLNNNTLISGNLSLGTQPNRATISYTTNTARTYTIPNVPASNFVMSDGSQTLVGIMTFLNTTGTTFTQQSIQDGFIIKGGATGSLSRRITLIPGDLSANREINFPDASGTVALTTTVVTLTGNQTITGTKEFINSGGTNFKRNAPWDNFIIQGPPSATSSTLTLTTANLTANRTITLPNDSGIVALTNGVVNLTGTQTVGGTKNFVDTGGTTFRRANFEDGIRMLGRTGGANSWRVTFTPTTLTANQTITLPDATGTLALTSSTVNAANNVIESRASNSLRFWHGTQAQYNAITTKNTDTIYMVE